MCFSPPCGLQNEISGVSNKTLIWEIPFCLHCFLGFSVELCVQQQRDLVSITAYLDQKVLGLGASLAISHQLLLTFSVGQENSSQSVKPSCRDELPLHGNTTSWVSSPGSVRKHWAHVTGWSYTPWCTVTVIQHALKEQSFSLINMYLSFLYIL